MAYFQCETSLHVPAPAAWDALRDVGNLHTRLVRGFVVDCRFDGETRFITFANGMTTAERIVSVSEALMRVSWSARSERLAHHNASAQVVPLTPSTCRVIWSVDVLPDAMAPAIEAMVQTGLQAIRSTLESAGAA